MGVHPPVHIGPGMEQLKNVLVLAPLEANFIVQNLQPQFIACRIGWTDAVSNMKTRGHNTQYSAAEECHRITTGSGQML